MNLIPSIKDYPEPSLRRAILAQLMRLANSQPFSPAWYVWKDSLLKHYGRCDGYDLQRIEAPCWTCSGTGNHENGECWDCTDGVHHITRTVLARWNVEDHIFHRPIRKVFFDGDLDALQETDEFRRFITGRVKHRPISSAHAREATAWILLICGGYRSWWAFMTRTGCACYPGLWPMASLQFALTMSKIEWGHWKSLWQTRHLKKSRPITEDIPF